MPTGTGAPTMLNLPEQAYKIDPTGFAMATQAKQFTAFSGITDPGATGGSFSRDLPRQGILAWATVRFEGTLTTVKGTGTVVTSRRYPYGLLDNVKLAANAQTGLIDARGEELHIRRLIANPAYEDNSDDFAGTVGGGDTISSDLTDDPLALTWQIPVVMDRTTLVGGLFAQSQRANLNLKVDRLATASTTAGAALLVLTGDAAATITGSWTISVETFDVPVDPADGALVIPDLSRFHGLQAFTLPVPNLGVSKLPLVQSNGQLARLAIQLRSNANVLIDPVSANQPNWTRLALSYGGNEVPRDWDPITLLLSRNNEHYGARLPYGFAVLDFVRENALRDAVMMQGVTDLRALIDIDSSVTLTDGSARIVQETLFQ